MSDGGGGGSGPGPSGHGQDRTPPNPGNNQGRRDNRDNRDCRKRNGKSGGTSSAPGSAKFKGACAALAGVVYDEGLLSSTQDLFVTTTRLISEYVAREYDKAGDFRLGMQELEVPPLRKPSLADCDRDKDLF